MSPEIGLAASEARHKSPLRLNLLHEHSSPTRGEGVGQTPYWTDWNYKMNMMSASDALASPGDNASGDHRDYARIGDVAKQYGVTLRTLRFYEDKGLITPLRDGNTRLYSRRDLSRLRLVLLGRQVGFTLREVKQMMDLYDPANGNARQLRVVVDKSERQLSRLNKQRDEIDHAINALKELVAGARNHLGKLKAA